MNSFGALAGQHPKQRKMHTRKGKINTGVRKANRKTFILFGFPANLGYKLSLILLKSRTANETVTRKQ